MARILYEEAERNGSLNPKDVKEILGVSYKEACVTTQTPLDASSRGTSAEGASAGGNNSSFLYLFSVFFHEMVSWEGGRGILRFN